MLHTRCTLENLKKSALFCALLAATSYSVALTQEEVASIAGSAMQSTKTLFTRDIKEGTGLEQWMELREALGIKKKQALYIFASLSMPESLLRAYQVEAQLAGASLVVRGIPKGMDMKTYIQSTAKNLYDNKMLAPLQIDPRLFDRYKITAVPTIVYAYDDGEFDCNNLSCEPAKESEYSSIKGNVTLLYALQQFNESGEDVKAFIQRFKGQNAVPTTDMLDNDGNPIVEAVISSGVDLKDYSDAVDAEYQAIVNRMISDGQTMPSSFEELKSPFNNKLTEIMGL